jgi:hypothetical protein
MIEIQVYFVTRQTYNPFNYGTLSFIIPSIAFLFLDFDPNFYFWAVALLDGIVFL